MEINSKNNKIYTFKPSLNKYKETKYDGYEFKTINNLDCLDEKSYNESSYVLKSQIRNEKYKEDKFDKNDKRERANYKNVILKEHIIKYK